MFVSIDIIVSTLGEQLIDIFAYHFAAKPCSWMKTIARSAAFINKKLFKISRHIGNFHLTILDVIPIWQLFHRLRTLTL